MPKEGQFDSLIESLEKAKAKEEFQPINENNRVPPYEVPKTPQSIMEVNNSIGGIEFVGFYNKLTGRKPHICLGWNETVELFKDFE